MNIIHLTFALLLLLILTQMKEITFLYSITKLMEEMNLIQTQ